MSDKTKLGDRMKAYESVPKNFLTRRLPCIIRLDGKSFHTFTRGMQKPFDPYLSICMEMTALHLCEEIQGCKFAYFQSDEISLLLTDYDTIQTDAFFGYNVQKMTSISAALASVRFQKAAAIEFPDKMKLNPIFDSRVFSLPHEEVCNYFIWRQQDATRNSIQMLGQSHFSPKQLHGKSCSDIQDLLMLKKDVNWNDVETKYKRGAALYKSDGEWCMDMDMPILTQDRDFVDKWVYFTTEGKE